VGESDYIDGQPLEGAQLGPAVVYRRARGVCAGAGCGCLSRSGSKRERAGSQVFGSGMLRFLAETVWRCCLKAALKPFLTYLKNNTCRRLIFIFLFNH
jgi:hypothetical protein